jgi:hypothetical protein
MNLHWDDILKDRLKLYGHRNWLVIADSAYPAQSRAGIETILANEDQGAVLDRVRAILGECEHVTATVYTDRELAFLSEKDAPGITAYREKLEMLVSGYQTHTLPHETIIWKLDQVAEKFRVLLIKTTMRLPYTTVFFELECGYWNAQAEKRLRAAMRSKDRRRILEKGTDGTSGRASEAKVST